MRQLFLDKELVAIKQAAQPFLEKQSVLISAHYCLLRHPEEATSATDPQATFSNLPSKIKKILSYQSKLETHHSPSPLGYSCSGRVLACGTQVTLFRPGDLVACSARGYANHADLICVPEHLVARVRTTHNLKAACMITPGTIALQAMRRTKIQLAEFVCILGLNLAGQLAAQLARSAGAFVIGIDTDPARVALAEELGMQIGLCATEHDLVNEINLFTQHQGADATIVSPDTPPSLVQYSIQLTRQRGRVVFMTEQAIAPTLTPAPHKVVDLLFAPDCGPGRGDRAYERGDYDYPYAHVRWTEGRNMQAFVDLIEKKAITVGALIQQELSPGDSPTPHKKSPAKSSPLATVLTYKQPPPSPDPAPVNAPPEHTPHTYSFIPAVREKIRIGIIGAGQYAARSLIPVLNTLNNVEVAAIYDAETTTPPKSYSSLCAYSSDEDLLNDETVDAVVITSPQQFRCGQALKALHRGKAVFVEKPVTIDEDQFQQLFAFLDENPNAPFCIGYHRSFAPFMEKIKRNIVKRKTPLIVQYRVNANDAERELWRRSHASAGRIIGDACHAINLFVFLTDAKPIAVAVEALHTARPDIFPTENFCAQISFDDGSVCSMLYSNLGHRDLGKERMELFFDGNTIVMDDYTSLFGFGLSSLFNEATPSPNRGHAALFEEFFTSLKQSPPFEPPISFDRLKTVAEVTLTIDRLACEGGGKYELQQEPKLGATL